MQEEWFEVFRTGEHTDGSGRKKTWTEQDLDKIVTKYNEQSEHEAPIVIGHPTDNAPAYGWVESLKRVGDTLFAKPKQLVKEFVECVKKGLYKKRSISLYEDGTLRHIGFLGAVPPAIKGLKDLKFSNNNNNLIYDYEENMPETPLIPDPNIPVDPNPEQIPTDDPANKIKELEEKVAILTELVDGNKDLKKQYEEMAQAKIDAENVADVKLKKAEFETFLTEKLNSGNINPAQVAKVKELLVTLEGIQDFAEVTRKSMLDMVIKNYKEFISGLPKLIKAIPSEVEKEQQAFTEKNELEELSDRMAGYVNKKKTF